MAREIKPTGRTTSVKKHDTDQDVTRKVWEVTDTVTIKKNINYDSLMRRRNQLQSEIDEIDDILAQIPADE